MFVGSSGEEVAETLDLHGEVPELRFGVRAHVVEDRGFDRGATELGDVVVEAVCGVEEDMCLLVRGLAHAQDRAVDFVVGVVEIVMVLELDGLFA